MTDGDQRSGAGRREGDHHPRWLRDNWYRDVWLLVVSALCLWAVLAALSAVHNQQTARLRTVRVTCAAISGVIDAGRQTITSSPQLPPRLERFLEGHGYPPLKVREQAAAQAAKAYASALARRVRRIADGNAKGVVRADGSLNCNRLQQVARVR